MNGCKKTAFLQKYVFVKKRLFCVKKLLFYKIYFCKKAAFLCKNPAFLHIKFSWNKELHALLLDHLTNPFIEDRLFSITWFELYWTIVLVRFSNYTLLDIRLVTFMFPCPHYRKHFIVGLLNSLVNSLKALQIYLFFNYFYCYFLFPLAFNFPGTNFICYAYWLKSHTPVIACQEIIE